MEEYSAPALTRVYIYARATTAIVSALALVFAPEVACALPVNGVVSAGAASITSSSNTTTITQSSSRAIVNWQNFDVGSGESVNFNQPSASSITLNRITGGGGASQIDGNISANGQVWLVNPQGMFFGSGSQVNVGGLLATTSNISDSNFMSGNYVFDQVGNALASITNAGTIHIADGGLAALVGPNVSNSGVITANLGKVQLGSGDTFSLDLYGDGLINLQASPAITSQLIDNSGSIQADGGKVLLTTAAAENAVNSLVNLDGIIQAGDIDIGGVVISHTGTMTATNNFTLTAKNIGQQGDISANTITENFTGAYIDNAASQTTANTVTISGGESLFASGHYTAPGGLSPGASAQGGTIVMAAENMWLYAAALDVSGSAGGGNIFLGDNNTQNISVNFYSTLKADALDSGNGGHIKVWSQNSTAYGASTSARGGSATGNGGLIEISSAGQDYVGGNTPDVSAPHGTNGTFLLDPHNITISDNSATGGGLAFFPLTNPDPSSASGYGSDVVALGNGNIVVTNPSDSFAASSAGAVYLFNGSTGALISTLRGSQANDKVGYGIASITALTGNNNFVIDSYFWANGAATQAGAVTWAGGTTGISGTVSSSNSLVGTQTNDVVGENGITPLTNGNYVVSSPYWANGAAAAAGAATWGNGTTGTTGVVSSSNSLVGSQNNDNAGIAVYALTNGNYVVNSYDWANGAASQAGAVTWGNGTTGTAGAISSSNSLVGSRTDDWVGGGTNRFGTSGITVLSNGNYVVDSSYWANGGVIWIGAVTFGCGSSSNTCGANGVTGTISSTNSLIGSQSGDRVGQGGVTELSNGNYVVDSYSWSNGGTSGVGAVTWVNGSNGQTSNSSNTISSANSLIGSHTNDAVGSGVIGQWGVTALTNGNYVVDSYLWDNGAVSNAGAVTWGNGTTGTTGTVSSSNSLVGSQANDDIGVGHVKALTNGNYVVSSYAWDNGAVSNAGAVTWGNGTTGTTGAVSSSNSLVGSQANDQVGKTNVYALTNGNYVVDSALWANGAATQAGAVTWGNGTTGITGAVSSSNSLVGSQANDQVGAGGVYALTNGNYVVDSSQWANGAASPAGAVTWGNGTTGITGAVSSANSLVGSQSNDKVGSGGITTLSNGNYVVESYAWANGAATKAGATTWGDGTTGVTGTISSANSLVGTQANDEVSGNGITALSNGNYLVNSIQWANGAATWAGAATFGSGTAGVMGIVSTANSIIGVSANSGFYNAIEDSAIGTFIVPFITAGKIYVSPSSGNINGLTSSFMPNTDFTVDTAYVAASLNAGTNVTLQAANNITVANSVTKTSGADATLTLQANNDITLNAGAVISSTTGKLNVVLDATGTGSITMNSGSGITSNGGDITLAASGGYFINNAGVGALSPGSGRWLIYSHDVAGDTYDGLSAAFTLYSCTYGGSCGNLGSGDGFLYAIAGSGLLTDTQTGQLDMTSLWIADLSDRITADPLNTATQRKDTTPTGFLNFTAAFFTQPSYASPYYIYNPYGDGGGFIRAQDCDDKGCEHE